METSIPFVIDAGYGSGLEAVAGCVIFSMPQRIRLFLDFMVSRLQAFLQDATEGCQTASGLAS
ncbi:hypothetical protein [Gluconacetobacter tumulicola]|uniref:Uncharacterized protein n=1 Tax=Gluconacetobacter tumulicola TaxID=1017177 RepID=A0A7W4JG61_9PROT|nr:hypothetical protein [Gluconacetobacter tumulicola]MBB2180618.1 hypothetical protein [Gluconacetobacter tumulicola]